MMLCRVFERKDGTISVYHPNPSFRRDGESDAAFLARMADSAPVKDPRLAGLEYADMEVRSLPQDRTQRDRWRLKGGRVVAEPERGQ